jgi:voltage-gated sodium channel
LKIQVEKKQVRNWLISEKMIISVIIVNALIIFLMAFENLNENRAFITTLIYLDELCLFYFLVEVILKIRMKGFKNFWSRSWDKFDLILVIITFPVLVQVFIPDLTAQYGAEPGGPLSKVFQSFMLLRLIRLMKLMKFIPNSEMLIQGIKRALKASIGVVMSLFILNLIFALGATILFKDIKGAEPFFGDPLNSMYTMFKIFTVEGWYEIPDAMINSMPESDKSNWMIFLIRSYFIVSVGTGGLLGLSLANAIFVDEMTLDNNIKLEELIAELSTEIRALKVQVDAAIPTPGPEPPTSS